MFDHAAKAGHAIKQRRGAKRGNQSRPEMQRRSSSLPPDNELQRLEEGRERGMGGRQGGRSGYGNDQRNGRRDRIYVDDHGEDYYVVSFSSPAHSKTREVLIADIFVQPQSSSRQPYKNDRGMRGYDEDDDNDDKVRRPRAESESRPKRSRSRRSSRHEESKLGLKSGKTHHIAAAVAGGVAGGFVGHSGGKGDMKIALAGALIGAIGAGFADQQLEKRRKDDKKEEKDWENKFER
jgi:hypothetical protein